MDFVGTLANKYYGLPEYWYLWLIGMFVLAILIQVAWYRAAKRNVSTLIIVRSILMVYIVFILMETIFGRTVQTEFHVRLRPFWSYGLPEYRMESILNYVLFIPLGLLLNVSTSRPSVLKATMCGFLLSASIEPIQLIFRIGLFEFDDMIGNTIGTLIGAVIGAVLLKVLGAIKRI